MRMVLAAAAALALSGAARAEPELALRAGVAFPIGDAAPDVPLSDALSVQFPVQLDALWRADRVAAGGYGSWAPARAGGCVPGAACDGSSWRAGVQAAYVFASPGGTPRGRPEPWAGVAAGWEWATHRRLRADGDVDTTWSGPEVSVQGGLEWRAGRRLALGPVLLVGLGRYRDLEVETAFDSGSAEVTRKTTHAWIHAGVRARLLLGRGGR